MNIHSLSRHILKCCTSSNAIRTLYSLQPLEIHACASKMLHFSHPLSTRIVNLPHTPAPCPACKIGAETQPAEHRPARCVRHGEGHSAVGKRVMFMHAPSVWTFRNRGIVPSQRYALVPRTARYSPVHAARIQLHRRQLHTRRRVRGRPYVRTKRTPRLRRTQCYPRLLARAREQLHHVPRLSEERPVHDQRQRARQRTWRL